MRKRTVRVAVVFTLVTALACGDSSTSPTAQLPLVTQSATTRYYYEPGDTVDVARQEAFNAWARDRLQLTLPQKVEYRKYFSRAAMGRYTGENSANAYAEPEKFTLHTIWASDNHEVVHILSAMVGRPSDFFNEGLAVSFQVDPIRNDFTVRFNGMQVHEACRNYKHAGTLPLPLSRYVTTAGFRGIADDLTSYRMAGSFVLFLQEQFGLSRVLAFFRTGSRDDPLSVIQSKFQQAFGRPIDEVEADWLAMLQ
jgi:hypothetical protein